MQAKVQIKALAARKEIGQQEITTSAIRTETKFSTSPDSVLESGDRNKKRAEWGKLRRTSTLNSG